ncbi:MAG: hypothetical protein AAF725_14495 [Acidobacteriota bacterium]
MSTKTVDETLTVWLDLEADDQLSAKDRAALEKRLLDQPELDLAAERGRNARLHGLLAESRVAVREGFQDDVMAALPAPAWQRSRASGAWRLPLAMMLFFALGAALLFGSAGSESQAIGTGLALFDFAQTTVLAGSGIVVAAWRGAGMGLEEMLASSSLNLVAFATLVVCLNLLFLSLMRRRRRQRARTADASESDI